MSSLLVTLTDKERFEIFYELGDVKNTGLHLYGEDGAKHKPNVGEMSDIIVEKSTSTKFHDNPLTTACREKNHPMVTMLTGYLRDHGRVDLVNSTILDGEAALYVASHAGCEQSVSRLVLNRKWGESQPSEDQRQLYSSYCRLPRGARRGRRHPPRSRCGHQPTIC